MQHPIMIRPQPYKFLFFSMVEASIASVGVLLVSLLYTRDVSRMFPALTGLWIVYGLVFFYHLVTKFEHFLLVVGEDTIQVHYKISIRLLSEKTLDKARTISSITRKNIDNQIFYTFWLITGERCYVNKFIYASSDIKIVLQKLGL